MGLVVDTLRNLAAALEAAAEITSVDGALDRIPILDVTAGEDLRIKWVNPDDIGGGGAPTTAKYITQTPDASLSAEQALSLLGTGLLKNTTGTGVLSIAAAGTDYAAAIPGSASEVLVSSGAGAALARSTFTVDGTGKVVAKNSSDSTTAFQVQNAAGTSVVSVDTTNRRIQSINLKTNTSDVAAYHLAIDNSGISGGSAAIRMESTGYSASSYNRVFLILNTGVSSGTDLRFNADQASPFTNAGFNVFCYGSGGGINIGNFCEALNSSTANIGLYGKARKSTAGKNIGVLGNGGNSGAGKAVGGWFGLLDAAGHPSVVNAALIADNGTTTDPILVCRDNSSTVFSLIDGGTLLLNGVAPSANAGPSQLVFGDTGTAPTPGTNTCIFYGDDVAGTVEGFVADEANNHTQLSSHPPDAPPVMLAGFGYVPLISKTIRYQLGEVHWIHGEKNDPIVATNRWVIIETFADYNARTGEDLVQMDVAAENTKRQSEFQADYDRVKAEQAKWKRLPRSVRGEFPKLPTPPKMVPSP